VRQLTADGDIRWIDVRARPALDPAGRVTGVFGTLTDVTLREEAEQRLSHQALHDGLTGLPNRSLFFDRLQQAIARAARTGDHVGVLFLDIDDFKAINDAEGHDAGDALLREMAAALDGSLRGTDTAARIGGDEFAMIADGLSAPEDAAVLAERLLRRLDGIAKVSVGVAVGSAGSTPHALLRDADAAMYRAKALGQHRVEIFDEACATAPTSGCASRPTCAALDRDELALSFQPIVALEDERLVGFEALLRWQHPARGAVSPADFIPVAESSGLIVPIGAWVVEEACRRLAGWTGHPAAADAFVAVNVSARQLVEPDFVCGVEAALRASALGPERLVLEITESVLVDDGRRTAETLDRLHGLGVRLALDDFGAGYSALSYLQRFAFDKVKIDRAFVAGMGEDPSSEAIVVAILGMAGALGMDVVAEGVERPEQGERLAALGCGLGQGWNFGRPLPAGEVERLLDAQPQRSAAGQTIR